MKNIDKLLQEEKNKRSHELFNKDECELQISELNKLNQYLYDLQHPIWKPIIDGVNTGYQVSNIGEVKNRNNEFISIYPNIPTKYSYVHMIFNHKKCLKSVHRLVAIAFIPNPENKPEVNHINGKKNINWYGNLEWNTRQENATHAANNGLIKSGIESFQSIHSEIDVHNVCKLAEQGFGFKYICDKLQLEKSFVKGILHNDEWHSISKNYNLPQPRHYADKQTVNNICKYLSKNISVNDISKELHVKPSLIYTIKSGSAWREISNNYDIPGLVKKENINEKLSTRIIDLLDSGITDTNIIIDRLGLIKPTKFQKQYIAKVRRKYFIRQEKNNK